MTKPFKSYLGVRAQKLLKTLNLQLSFSDNEHTLLQLFFDEKLKVRRRKIPLFYFYAQLCDKREEDEWASIMAKVDIALTNLISVGYLQKVTLSRMGSLIEPSVGRAAETYELTASGLEMLQDWHPSLAAHLKAWLVVAPAWVVTIATIFSGIGTIWGVVTFVRLLTG